MRSSWHDPTRFEVIFDDERAVANAGLTLTGILTQRLGIEDLADGVIDLGDRPGGAHPGRKVMTLLHAMVVGGDCIDDVNVLRSGSTDQVVGHRVMAPSTIGTFLRSFTFGHVRQLDRLFDTVLSRAWHAGAGPGNQDLVIDVDSTVCEVHGYHKQGARFNGHTKQLGYHPLLATRADTGEILHVRQRTGSATTGRGANRFVAELIARVRRAGSTGQLTVRADSGFYLWELINTLRRHQVQFSITVRLYDAVKRAIAGIDEDAWTPIAYTTGGEAQVAETRYGPHKDRLVVRRTRLVGPQATLWPDWRYHAFLTNRPGDPVVLDTDHRRHAVCELVIRDWKGGAGANHAPSGVFAANAAWTVLSALAHNLIRWVAHLGLGDNGPVVAKTIRRRLITLPGRITRRSRRQQLHLPRHWPWSHHWHKAFHRLRNLPVLT